MLVNVGDTAPDFALFSTEKKEVTLNEYEGKNVVLLFFPLAFTSVCTTELCTIRDDKKTYDSLNAEIIGISIDSLFTLEKFKAEQSYNFTMLSDFNREVSRAYGVLYDEFVLGMRGVSRRSAFVLDKTGKIHYAEVLESAGDLPNFDKIKETLSALN